MAIPALTTMLNTLRPGEHTDDRTNNLTIAYYHLSNLLGSAIAGTGTIGTNFVVTNENEGLAVAYLAAALIDNSRAEVKKSIKDLVDDEIRHLLFNEGDDLDSSVWVTSNAQPQSDWEVTRYT